MSIFWFVLFLFFLVVELSTVNLVSIWFAVGAVAAFISTYLTDVIFIQAICFISISVLSLILTKPLVKKFKGFDIIPTNSDQVIGKYGIVTKKITKDHYGEVKVLGNIWTAKSENSKTIALDEEIEVVRIEGVKLIVKKKEEN